MMRYGRLGLGLVALAALATRSEAGNVLVLSSGDSTLDDAVIATLTGFGHTASLGPQFTAFDGTQSLAGIDTVYLQVNANWNTGDMPTDGQTQLVNFVSGGGGLVTSEWLLWKVASQGAFATLDPIFPAVPTGTFNGNTSATFSQAIGDAILNAGLPGSFTFSLTSIAGTETLLTETRFGAVTYYNNVDSGALGLVGWDFGAGQVLNFSTVNGLDQVNDPAFGRLLSNAMGWSGVAAAAPEPGTLTLAGVGLLTLGVGYRRRRR